MKNVLYAFLGGALVGGIAAVLLAPESGEELRARIKQRLKEKGMDLSDTEIGEFINRLSAQIKG